ncbi:HRDC domain-containing protein [Paenibacillus hodogayensis]|uniref:HRDC domain-containing protein n=1 Tax=Paenibacillus hodogayensis TaxID=279208 RepID=A0ABV5VS02_9BACL
MNLVFLSSFEKEAPEGEGVVTAQVSIAEQFGEWHVWWYEPEREGTPSQESWYTGPSWDEMMAEFRTRTAEKRQVGFRPLVGPTADPDAAAEGSGDRGALLRKLEYYGELHADAALYETLRRWRNSQAASEGRSPFIIASNRLLKMVSAFKPHTPEELRQIPGFGEQRVSLYADGILALTGGERGERQTAFPLDWVSEAVDTAAAEQWVRQRQEQRRKDDTAKQELKRKLLEGIAEGTSIDEMEQALPLSRRELVSRMEELDKEGCDLEPLIERELAAVPGHLVERAWGEFASSGDRFLRPILQRLYDEKSLDESALTRAYEWLRLLRVRYRNSKPASSAPPAVQEENAQTAPEKSA